MDKQKAQEVLISAIKIAVKHGVFELNDCAVIAQAVNVLTTPDPKQQEIPALNEIAKNLNKSSKK